MPILLTLSSFIAILIAIAMSTLAERKVLSAYHRRYGPNVVGIFGLLQPVADGLKLVLKPVIAPTSALTLWFLIAPIWILSLSFITWMYIPFGFKLDAFDITPVASLETTWYSLQEVRSLDFLEFEYGVLLMLALSSLGVYGIIIAGWSSQSKYAFLGALRSAAQMISYEVVIGVAVLPVTYLARSLNLADILFIQEQTIFFGCPLLPSCIAYFIGALAETNRTPFDLTEAEAELVGGYNTEYSSSPFAMFFLAEYNNILIIIALFIIYFFSFNIPGISPFVFMSIKIALIFKLFIAIRATYPRLRYSNLMDLCWKNLLPIVLTWCFITPLLTTYFMQIS